MRPTWPGGRAWWVWGWLVAMGLGGGGQEGLLRGLRLEQAQGKVEVHPAGVGEWLEVGEGELVFPGDLFRTREGTALFALPDGGRVLLSPGSTMEFRRVEWGFAEGEARAEAVEMVLWKGEALLHLFPKARGEAYRLRTPEWNLVPLSLPLRLRWGWEKGMGSFVRVEEGEVLLESKSGQRQRLAPTASPAPAPMEGFPLALWERLDEEERSLFLEVWKEWSPQEREALLRMSSGEWERIHALARTLRCQRNLRSVKEALERYLEEHGGRFPEAGRFWEALEPYRPAGAQWRCPEAPPQERGWAWNEAWSGRLRGEMVAPRVTPLLYDATPQGALAARHNGGLNLLWGSGSITWMRLPLPSTVRWGPP